MFAVVLELNDRYCKLIKDGFESEEAAWEWMYTVDETSYYPVHYLRHGRWVVLTDEEWKRAQQIARTQGPWHDMPKGHKLYPWSFFCPDCGSSHGRGKGPYGLGMHYCVNGWTGPVTAPSVRRKTSKKAKRCKAEVFCQTSYKMRQCRNGIQPHEEYCYLHGPNSRTAAEPE